MSEFKTDLSTKAILGDLAIDCTTMAPFLVDLPRGERSRLRPAQDGLDLVLAEIDANQPNIGASAGVTTLDYDTLTEASRQIDLIDEQLPAARKLVELLEETRAYAEDRRQRQIAAIATAVESRAKVHRDDALLARYERTREYYSLPGVRSWKARRKNEGAEPELPVDTGQPVPVPVPGQPGADAGVGAATE